MTQSVHAKPRIKDGSQLWSDLKNAWRSYKIAKMNSDKTKMIEYAKKIVVLQQNLGAKLADFPELR